MWPNTRHPGAPTGTAAVVLVLVVVGGLLTATLSMEGRYHGTNTLQLPTTLNTHSLSGCSECSASCNPDYIDALEQQKQTLARPLFPSSAFSDRSPAAVESLASQAWAAPPSRSLHAVAGDGSSMVIARWSQSQSFAGEQVGPRNGAWALKTDTAACSNKPEGSKHWWSVVNNNNKQFYKKQNKHALDITMLTHFLPQFPVRPGYNHIHIPRNEKCWLASLDQAGNLR